MTTERLNHLSNFAHLLNLSERNRAYGIMELSISAPLLLGSLYFMGPGNLAEPSQGVLAAVYVLANTAAFCAGGLGIVDGVSTTYRGHQEVESTKSQIAAENFKIRGFFLNRTVTAA